jgi:hypothetical protein
VSTAAVVIQTFQTDKWNADLYGALSVVSNVEARVKDKANVIRITYLLHKMNRQLQRLFDKINLAAEGKISPQADAPPVTEKRAREMIGDLVRMYRSLDILYQGLRRAGLLNNSLTSSQLLKLRVHSEAVLDLVDWIETSLETEEVNAIFDRASAEREHGLFDLEQAN